MRSRTAIGLVVVALVVHVPACASAEDARPPAPDALKKVPEPAGLWNGPMHSATPATLAGATVIDAAKVAEMRGHAVMIDVAYADRKPSAQPGDLPWTPIHRSIPGATWMPGSGNGTDDPAFVKAFVDRVTALTGGDRDKPVVTFCHPQRWGSWNAAKRLTEIGYHHVYWFPGGAEGWQDNHQPADLEEDASWVTALRKIRGENADATLPPMSAPNASGMGQP